MKKYLLLLACLLSGFSAQAQDMGTLIEPVKYEKVPKSFRFRVTFTDKKGCGFSVKKPKAFLSPKSIARRKRYGLKVDAHDLPLTPAYLQALREMGLTVGNVSKWNNSAVVSVTDSARMEAVRRLPFVSEARCVWISPDSVRVGGGQADRAALVTNLREPVADFYGHAATQVRMLGVDSLHRAGLKGAGVTIAVIDGGFHNADLVSGLRGAKVLGTRNFVRPRRSVYEELSHGMMVLSCIAANDPHSLVGTAPEASFYLLQSEDGDTEQLVEEDNWCTAVEYADSLGCDIVTSSLGYYLFDHKEMNHTYRELDGRTALNSRSASLAASRGILLLNSAGNSGMSQWKKIGVPADARDMLAVGAVFSSRGNTFFSSIGDAADGRVKPDVMAMGEECAVYDISGGVTEAAGTSFACPILCGAAACLVQAFPKKRPAEVVRALQQSGHNAEHPDNIYGYGIPDVVKAYSILQKGK